MGLFRPPNIEKMKEKRDVPGLVKALEYQKGQQVRREAVRVLGELKDTRALDPLIAALEDTDPGVCCASIEALGGFGEAASIRPLVARLCDPRLEIRQTARRVLIEVGAPAVKPLLELLKDNREENRRAAVDVIVAIGAPAVDPLCTFIGNTDRLKGSLVADALGRIGDRRALGALEAALQNRSKEIRCAAAKALGDLGDPGAVEPLLDLLDDQDVPVQKSAAEALVKLGWKPGLDAAGAKYWISRKDWEKCVETGAPAVAPLVASIVAKISPLDAAGALEKIHVPQAVEPLIEALAVNNDEARRAAAAALGATGDERAIQPLIAALESESREVRKAATGALGKIGGARTKELLATALHDPNQKRRLAAAEILGRLGWEPETDDSRAAYWINKGDWEQCVRLGKPAVLPLIAALESGELTARQAAAGALGSIGDERAVEPLLKAALHGKAQVAQAASMALLAIGTPAVEPALALLRSAGARDRAGAAQLLESLGWKPASIQEQAWHLAAKQEWEQCAALGEPAIEPLLLALKHADDDRRKVLIGLLGGFKDARLVEPLLEILTTGYREVRNAAADALARIGDLGAVEPLIAALKNKDNEVRETAMRVLGALRDARAVESLIVILKDPQSYLRRAAAQALGKIGDVRAVEPLMDSFKDPEGERAEVMSALGDIGDARAVGLLAASLRHRNCDISRAAAYALEKFDWKGGSQEEQACYLVNKGQIEAAAELGEPAVDSLLAAMKTSWPEDERAAGVTALGRIGGRRAVEPLIEMLGSHDFAMRQAAARALIQLYREGKLPEAEKQSILQKRGFIEGQHNDQPGGWHEDISCDHAESHYDSGGAAIKFPL